MPMKYTDADVIRFLKNAKQPLDGSMTECRERLAAYIESEFDDFLDAWEVRTGRPWTSMTKDEAKSLLLRCPRLQGNPGFLSRLHQ